MFTVKCYQCFIEVLHYSNEDLMSIMTPLKLEIFAKQLEIAGYDMTETKFLVDGFTSGFDIGYAGPEIRQSSSHSIPLTIGTKEDLWNKIMNEVKAGQVAGLFDQVPFQN